MKLRARLVVPFSVVALVALLIGSLAAQTPLLPQPGSLDTTFNGTGRVVTSLGGTAEYVADVAAQLDGRIIVAGSKDGGPTRDFAVVRYLPNGSLDTSFNGTGIVTTDFQLTGDTASSVLIQPDQRIVVIGFCWSPGSILIARYNPDGTLDNSFGGGDGKVTAPTPMPYPYVNDAALQSDGKIVVVGNVRTDPYSGVLTTFLARFLPDGNLDPTFATGGLLHPAVNSVNAGLRTVLLQPDGKIVAGGGLGVPAVRSDLLIARYASNGELDTTFSGDGLVVQMFPDWQWAGALDLALQPDGKLVAAGGQGLARFDADGTLDASFHGDGHLIQQTVVIVGIRIQQNGKIVAAGGYVDGSSFRAARFHSDGTNDLSFGPGGWIEQWDMFGGGPMTLQRNGRIVAAGPIGLPHNQDIVVARFHGDPIGARSDFDGDARSEPAVFRLTDGTWYARRSDGAMTGMPWGQAGDVITPADFDGDGATDHAVFRPSEGNWWMLHSFDQSIGMVNFGFSSDMPVAADYDADGWADVAAFRPADGTWHVLQSLSGAYFTMQFGATGDQPVPGDYDGDGHADFAVWRPASATWYIQGTTAGFIAVPFGAVGDQPAPADYDGDGKTDLAVYHAATGMWSILNSTGSIMSVQFGAGEDQPAAGDFDGDGKADIANFRPSTGIWYVLRSTLGFWAVQFGANGDVPVPSRDRR